MKVWGKRECKETPEERRKKKMLQYPYLTWLLRKLWGEKSELTKYWRQEIAEGKKEEKKCEEEIKRLFEGKKREVVK